MIKTELRKGDGLNSGRPWLNSVVHNMQTALMDAEVLSVADGKFGGGTEKKLKEFQRSKGKIDSLGVVDIKTWRLLQPHLEATVLETEASIEEILPSFRGDLEWIHAREGHLGKPYWPGGASGVTLDPGVDLGHLTLARVEVLYKDILTKKELKLLSQVDGIKGEGAKAALRAVPGLLDIRISRNQASKLFPIAAKPYWEKISKRMKGLSRVDTPASVQTVLLSLAYNRGVFNRDLEPLKELIMEKSWQEVASRVAKMQQRHELKGIRIRRRQEGNLVIAELGFLNAG